MPFNRLIAFACLAAPLSYVVGVALTHPGAPCSAAQIETDHISAQTLIADYIDANNEATAQAFRAFEKRYRSSRALASRSMDDRLDQAASLQLQWGHLTLREIVGVNARVATALIDTELAGLHEFTFEFEPREKGKLSVIRIMKASGLEPVDAESRQVAIEALAGILAQDYVFPDKGAHMARKLRRNLEHGAYSDVANRRQLAWRLTEDLLAICGDKHLRIVAAPAPAPDGPPDAADQPLRMPPPNAGFRKVEILDGNIGYIRFDAFIAGAEAERIASAAMDFVASSNAVIFDLRHNGGGHPAMVAFITSYLLDQPTHINSFYDRQGERVAEYWTLENIPGRRLGESMPVYILTSSQTFSGAEEFAYNLRALQRATLIGEVTGGGAHPVRSVRFGDGFVVSIPYMRAQNPVTRENWEGVGVEPHVIVPAAQALERAVEEITSGRPQVMLMD